MPGFAGAGSAGRVRDVRDRLILALYAQLKAERETREALEYAIRHGAMSPEVLEAIVSDPVPVMTDDVAAIEKVVALDRRPGNRPQTFWGSSTDHHGSSWIE